MLCLHPLCFGTFLTFYMLASVSTVLFQLKQPPSRFTLGTHSGAANIPPRITPPMKLEKMREYRDALASTAELLDPTPPSVAMYCVHSTENRQEKLWVWLHGGTSDKGHSK